MQHELRMIVFLGRRMPRDCLQPVAPRDWYSMSEKRRCIVVFPSIITLLSLASKYCLNGMGGDLISVSLSCLRQDWKSPERYLQTQ